MLSTFLQKATNLDFNHGRKINRNSKFKTKKGVLNEFKNGQSMVVLYNVE